MNFLTLRIQRSILALLCSLVGTSALAAPSPYAQLQGLWSVSTGEGETRYQMRLTQVAHPSETDSSRLYNISFEAEDAAIAAEQGGLPIWVIFGPDAESGVTAYWQLYKDTRDPRSGDSRPLRSPVSGRNEIVAIESAGAAPAKLVFKSTKGAFLRRMSRSQ